MRGMDPAKGRLHTLRIVLVIAIVQKSTCQNYTSTCMELVEIYRFSWRRMSVFIFTPRVWEGLLLIVVGLEVILDV